MNMTCPDCKKQMVIEEIGRGYPGKTHVVCPHCRAERHRQMESLLAPPISVSDACMAAMIARSPSAMIEKYQRQSLELREQIIAKDDRIMFLEGELHRRAADINESERAELARLRAENADLQKTIDEQNDDINTLAEERQRLRAVVAKLGDAQMVVPVEWVDGYDENHLRTVEGNAPFAWSGKDNKNLDSIEQRFGVIRLRDGVGEKAP